MAFFGASRAVEVQAEPFIAPDLSELSDRELLEATYIKMLTVEHLFGQVIKAAASNPMLGAFIPKGL